MSTVWVVTSEVNAYDQYGEYFECVFLHKPTPDDLSSVLSTMSENDLEHLSNGGGRRHDEHSWYNLREEKLN